MGGPGSGQWRKGRFRGDDAPDVKFICAICYRFTLTDELDDCVGCGKANLCITCMRDHLCDFRKGIR